MPLRVKFHQTLTFANVSTVLTSDWWLSATRDSTEKRGALQSSLHRKIWVTPLVASLQFSSGLGRIPKHRKGKEAGAKSMAVYSRDNRPCYHIPEV